MALSSNSAFLWNYVTVATKVATDYVGLTNKTNSNQNRRSNVSQITKTNKIKKKRKALLLNRSRTDLYSEMGIECLNFLANLLDSSRPRLNNHKISTKSSLSRMQKNYVLLIEIFTYLPFENVVDIMVQIESDEERKYNQLKLAADYLLFNDVSGHQYLRKMSINGYSWQTQTRNIIWPYLIWYDALNHM